MAAELNTLERLEIRLALEDLNTAFVHHLDHGDIDSLIDLFCEDAVYTHGNRRSDGRQAIADLFRRRTSDRIRTARHLYSGLRLCIENTTKASGTSVCLTFAADGPPPHPAKPLLVADFIDEYTFCADGQWRFRRRDIKRIFVDPDHPDPVGLRN